MIVAAIITVIKLATGLGKKSIGRSESHDVVKRAREGIKFIYSEDLNTYKFSLWLTIGPDLFIFVLGLILIMSHDSSLKAYKEWLEIRRS